MKNKHTILALIALSAFAQSCGNEIKFDACGQIEATEVTVSAEAAGKILYLDVEEGDRVESGRILGMLDSVQTALQIQELEERMDGAKSRLVDVAQQSEPDRRELANLGKDYERYCNLLKSNAATQKQVDDIESKIAVLKARIDAQVQSWERGNASIGSEISSYRIQLAQKEDQLEKCRIKAPVSGTVLTKYAEAGESVVSGKGLLKIADMDNVYVRAYFTTSQLAGLKLGDRLTVIPDDGTPSPREYEGRIISISSQAEFTPKNIQTRDERADLVYAVKVAVENDGALRLGMYAYVRK